MELRGGLGQRDGGFYALLPDSGDEHFLRRCRFRRHAQHIAGFGVVEHHSLAGGTQDDHPGQQAA